MPIIDDYASIHRRMQEIQGKGKTGVQRLFRVTTPNGSTIIHVTDDLVTGVPVGSKFDWARGMSLYALQEKIKDLGYMITEVPTVQKN